MGTTTDIVLIANWLGFVWYWFLWFLVFLVATIFIVKIFKQII